MKAWRKNNQLHPKNTKGRITKRMARVSYHIPSEPSKLIIALMKRM